MDILVLNGSPQKGEKSATFTCTSQFLEGMKEEHNVTVIDVIEKDIQYCKGCLSCWMRQDGHCVIQDDMNSILDLMKNSDMIIWSFPLYEYGLPAPLKTLVDRTNPFLKWDMVVTKERTFHETVVNIPRKKNVIICGCGFPYFEDNFAGLKLQMKNILIQPTMLCIFESPLVLSPDPALQAKKERLFAALKKAGAEYEQQSFIQPDTQQQIEEPFLPADEYVSLINSLVK